MWYVLPHLNTVCCTPTRSLLLQHRGEADHPIIHIAYEIMPISIVINEASPINIELEHGLEAPVNLLEVLRVTFHFDHLDGFVDHLRADCVRLSGRFLVQ